MKNQKGFTLVEAIVVAIIMAILAAVAIPLYTGYVQSAQADSALSSCELIGAAVIQTHNRGIKINASTFTDIGITSPGNTVWAFEFDGLNETDAMLATYTIRAISIKYGTYFFKPKEVVANRWLKQP
jgi:type IV pilus assembly protein PilE